LPNFDSVTLAANFDIISPMQVMFSWKKILNNFELWRLLTCFCYAGPFDISMIFGLYMQLQFSKQYEAGGPFNTGAGGGTADYVFCLLFGAIALLITYPGVMMIMQVPPVFTRNLVFAVLYIWSRRHPTANANIWGVPIPAIYLPFAYLALSVFMGNAYADMLHGLAVGHLYYYLADVVPQVTGKDILRTPQFLVDQFGVGEYQAPVAPAAARPAAGAGPGRVAGLHQPAAAAQAAPAQAGGHQWGGTGRALGRD
jgi:Derlin-2/3